MKKLIFLLILLFAAPAFAGPYTVGTTNQTVAYTFPHVLGDGSDVRGGTPAAYAYEETEIATADATIATWTATCVGDLAHDGAWCGEFADSANVNGYGNGAEAKARFDCNVAFEAHDDPILAPGVPNGSTHDHTFFGNVSASAAPYNATYASLRASGNATCYGGLLNRTLYWEPSMKLVKNGVVVTHKPRNIVTYYTTGSMTDGTPMQRWPRGLKMIFGYDMSDPTNTWGNTPITAVDPSHNNYTLPFNGFVGWACSSPATPSYTAYSPNKTQGAAQPYLNDGAGHATLNCTSQTISGFGTGIRVFADLNSQGCWDGVNLESPNGRKHLMPAVADQRINTGSRLVCPDHWYKIPIFEAKVEFAFTDATEMAGAYLASDRMDPNSSNWLKGGQSMHADLIPAWSYGTGDKPGAMLTFFQHCDGLTMHVKNADGTTYTDLAGDPHECGTARISATKNLIWGASPDASSPNPVANLNPDQTGANRFFPLTTGTPLPGSVMHTHP